MRAFMVVAWLVTSPTAYRQYEPQRLPFQINDSIRKRHYMVLSDDLMERLSLIRRDNGQGDDGDDRHGPLMIVGLVDTQPAFQYDHMKALSDHERLQYQHWVLGLQAEAVSLWFFYVSAVHELQTPEPLAHYCRRNYSKTYRMLDSMQAAQLMQSISDAGDVPDWFQDDDPPRLAFIVPVEFIKHILTGAWQRFAMPSPFLHGPFGTPAWFQKSLDQNLKGFMEATQDKNAIVAVPPFNMSMCSQFLADLRRVCSGQAPPTALTPWTSRLQVWDDMLAITKSGDANAKMKGLIDLMLLSDVLKNSDNLKKAMIKSCEILLPPGVFAVLEKFICQAKVPDKSQISRFRLTMDTAMMLLERRRHWREYKQGEQHVRYLMWDSSPQFGRDYELALVHSLAFCHLAAAWKLACCIQGTADKQTEELLNSEEDDSDLLDKHAKDMARLHGMLGVHSLPCVLIGFGASSFAHKFGALLHSMRLEHFDNESLAYWVKSLATALSDDGTERLLSKVMPVAARSALPWFEDTPAKDIHMIMILGDVIRDGQGGDDQVFEADDNPDGFIPASEDDGQVFEDVDGIVEVGALGAGRDDIFEDEAGREDIFEDAPEDMIDLQAVLGMSGLLHVIDNATNGLQDILPNFEVNVEKAIAFCKIIRKRDNQPKLLERCFGSAVGRQFWPLLKSFKGWIHLGRWGTLAFSIPEIMRVEGAMKWGWDKDAYVRGAQDDGDEGQAHQARVQEATAIASMVDDAVTDVLWWAWVEDAVSDPFLSTISFYRRA